MGDELQVARRAADRLLARGLDEVTGEVCAAGVVLACLFDREHPADDGEPATKEWCLENGAERPYTGEYADELYWRIETPDRLGTHAVVKFKPDGPPRLGITGASIVFNPTRGDVRRLLWALGVRPA